MKDHPPANWKVGLLVLLIFIVVAYVSNLEKALASSVTFGVFAAVIQTKWDSRRDWRLWSVIAVFALIHIIVIYVVPLPQAQAGLVSLPFALVDGFVMWGLTNWIEKRFPRASNRHIS